MNCPRANPLAGLLLLLSSTVLGGCLGGSTAPSRFYLLTPLEEAERDSGQETATGPSVHLAAVQLPSYLDDPQVVTRISRNELQYAKFDRWAERLADNFARVLVLNLVALLPDHPVLEVPWERGGDVGFGVTVTVSSFEATDSEVVLTARWLLQDASSGEISTRVGRYVQPVSGDDYEGITLAMSAAVAALSRDIAGEIQSQ